MSVLFLLLLACSPDPGVDRDDSGGPGWGLEVTVDPDMGSLLWARWEQPQAGEARVEWLLDEGWVAGPSVTRDRGPQEALVLGVPFGVEATLRVVSEEDTSETVTITTDPLPGDLTHGAVLTSYEPSWDPASSWVFTSSVGMTQGESWSVIQDRDARIVWASRSPDGRLTLQPQVSRDGEALLIDHNSFYGSLDGGAGSQVRRLAIDGTELALYDTPGLHHGFAETGTGAIAWGATDGGGHDSLEILDTDGSQHSLWDCEGFFAELGVVQACQNNGVAWDAASDGFLVSLFATNSLVELDGDGQAQRWFGQLPQAWSFSEPGTAFWWQHGAHLTDTGTLLLSTHSSAMSDEIMVREYSVDDGGERLTQIWSHGDDERIEAPLGGSVARLPGGNTLHNTGNAGRIRELTPNGELVWELTFPDGTYLGRATPIEDLYALLP